MGIPNRPPVRSEMQIASDQELFTRLAEERTAEAHKWPFKSCRTVRWADGTTEEIVG